MQGYVPFVKVKKSRNELIKSVLAGIFIIFIIVVLFVVLVSFKKKELCFEKRDFYLVSAVSGKNEDVLISYKDKIKSVGGAGVVVEKKHFKYLIVNAYLVESDAENVKKKMIKDFEQSEVVKLTAPDISKKSIREIKNNEVYYRFMSKKFLFFERFVEKEIAYLKSDLSVGKFGSFVISEKLEFENMIKEFDVETKSDVFLEINVFGKQFVALFNDFLDKFFESTKKQSLICEFFVNCVVLNMSLCEKL